MCAYAFEPDYNMYSLDQKLRMASLRRQTLAHSNQTGHYGLDLDRLFC